MTLLLLLLSRTAVRVAGDEGRRNRTRDRNHCQNHNASLDHRSTRTENVANKLKVGQVTTWMISLIEMVKMQIISGVFIEAEIRLRCLFFERICTVFELSITGNDSRL